MSRIEKALAAISEEVGWLRDSVAKSELEREESRAQFDRHVEWAANLCACAHDGRGALVNECQEHQQIREQRDELLAALNGMLGLVQIADSRGDLPLVLAENHRYVDALALVNRIELPEGTSPVSSQGGENTSAEVPGRASPSREVEWGGYPLTWGDEG